MTSPFHVNQTRLLLIAPLILAGLGVAARPALAQYRGSDTSIERQHKCANHKSRKNKKILGAIGGAAIGGLIGRSIDGGKHHEAGTILGAAGGAYAGQAIAGSLTSCDRYFQEEAAVRAAQTGQTQTWSNRESGHTGTVKRAQSFTDSQGRECNTITTSAGQDSAGKAQTMILCKNADGYWEKM